MIRRRFVYEGGEMAPMVHSVEIDRSREDVFSYVTDPARFPEWQKSWTLGS